MKKSVYFLLMIFALSFSAVSLNSCREEKSAGEKMEDSMEEAGDDMEDAADDVEDEMEDAGDEVEDAADDY